MSISETRILLNLPKEFKKLLDRQAKKRRLTRSGLIRLALTEWIKLQHSLELGEKLQEARNKESKKKAIKRIEQLEKNGTI